MRRGVFRLPAVLIILLAQSTLCSTERSSENGLDGDTSRGDDDLQLASIGSALQAGNSLKVFANDKRMPYKHEEPVTLTIYFEIKESFEEIEFKLPRGYSRYMPDSAAEKKFGCGVYDLGKSTSADSHSEAVDGQEYAKMKKSEHIARYIENCHVSQEMTLSGSVELPQVTVRISFKSNFPGRALDKGVVLKSWGWAMHVRNPEVSPSAEDNWFTMTHFWAFKQVGQIRTQGWHILGDWDCTYSDWEGWGNCPAQCGGGVMRLTRRLLLEPPPRYQRKQAFADPCPGPFEKNVTCNDFPCKFPCELVEVGEPGVCSAECGGGVRPVRWKWRGGNCPKQDDEDAVQWETCNPQPCKVRCKLADTWTVVTGCSEVCGQGTYRMMREVLQKDKDDPACQPEWREVKCVRQWCTQLSIIRPDRNILPYPSDTYYVGIAFKLTFPVEKVVINAPGGYSFGKPGSNCELHDHDLFPYYKGCKVGTKFTDTEWGDPSNRITLEFNGVLEKNENGRYSFMIPVTHPKCPMNDFQQVVQIGESPGRPEVCALPFDQNLWEMQLTRDLAAEGHMRILSLWAKGYDLHNPKESHKETVPGGKELYWGTTNDGAYVTAEKGGPSSTWRTRITYCSARLEPCPNGDVCPRSGVCPNSDYSQFDGDDSDVEDGTWSLNAAETSGTAGGDDGQSIENEELEAANLDESS